MKKKIVGRIMATLTIEIGELHSRTSVLIGVLVKSPELVISTN